MNERTYTSERRVFERLKADCTEESKREYELAFKTLLERYNTTIRENRFLAGGAVEVFTYALLCSVGIDCQLYADQSMEGDLLLPNHKMLSVKGTFTGGAGDVKLMNKLGSSNWEWTTATLFVISEVGIVYGTPNMVNSDDIRDSGDGVVLKRRAVRGLIEKLDNVFPMNLPRKPPPEMTGFSYKASTAVARQIMWEMKTVQLLKAFDN